MNGRCETDPLDRAVDVCDRCFGEYCEEHLLRPKGRKHPFCSECALAASGVRGSAKVELRGDRRTAKKRRKALQEATSAEEHVFEFFDQDSHSAATPDPATVDGTQDTDDNIPIPEFESYGAKPVGAEDADAGADDAPPTPAVAQLEQLRRDADDDPEGGPDDDSGDLDGTANPGSSADAPLELPRGRSKIEAPDRRRPIEPQRLPQEPGAGLGQLPNRQATRPLTAPPPERPPAAERSTPDTAESSPVPPGGAKDRRRTPPPTHRRPTAPMIGEVRNVAGRRADDQSIDHPGSADGDRDDEAVLDPTGGDAALNAVEGFDAGRPPSTPATTATPDRAPSSSSGDEPSQDEAEQTESANADTDAQGNWIPPVLRGIAADAAEAKADLPQRPRR